MPYSDREKQKEWYRQRIAGGYGKVLWRRRKQVYANETEYRAAIEDAIVFLGDGVSDLALERLRDALRDADQAAADLRALENEIDVRAAGRWRHKEGAPDVEEDATDEGE